MIYDRSQTKAKVKDLQNAAYPLKLVINPSWGGALGLRHKAEIFYLNFPKVITIKPESKIDHEVEVNEKNFHLIRTELQDLLKQIKIERTRALKHHISVALKFFIRSKDA